MLGFMSSSDPLVSKKPGVSTKVMDLLSMSLDLEMQKLVSESGEWPILNVDSPNKVFATLLFPAPVFPRRTILRVGGTTKKKKVSEYFFSFYHFVYCIISNVATVIGKLFFNSIPQRQKCFMQA